jgi:hypothetical protein
MAGTILKITGRCVFSFSAVRAFLRVKHKSFAPVFIIVSYRSRAPGSAGERSKDGAAVAAYT